MRYEQLRHQPPRALVCTRPLIVAASPLRSHVNAARIVRAAGSLGIRSLVLCGKPKLDPDITRDALDFVDIQFARSLAPILRQKLNLGFHLVGLEQATGSKSIFDFAFPHRTVLVVGNERAGLPPEILALLHDVVEIPVFGKPASFNSATSAIIGMYEYCRQFPDG